MKKIIYGTLGLMVILLGILLEPHLFSFATPKANAVVISSGEKIHVLDLDSSIDQGSVICVTCVVLVDGKETNSGWEICKNQFYAYTYGDSTVAHIAIDLLEGDSVVRQADATIEFRIARVERK